MAEKLKVAIIGTNIGCTLHIRALRGAGFEIKALVGRDPDQTAYRAAHFGVPLSLTSVGGAIDSGVDAVVIATPPVTHHQFAMQAIAAGKHVLCEKPLAIDTGQAREMRDAAEAAGLVHMVTHEFRWFAQNALLRHIVRSGRIGTPVHVTALFDHMLCAAYQPELPAWWMSGREGGGWLRNYNAHGIDLIRYMISDFAAVCGTSHPGTDRGMTADDGYSFAFVLANDAQGVMAGSARAHDYFASTRVVGSEGTANLGMDGLSIIDASGTHRPSLPAEVAEELRGTGPVVSAPIEALPKMDDTLYTRTHSSDVGYPEQVALCAAFAARIRDRGYRNPAFADFGDGVAHMQIIEVVERSRADRRWIDLI